MKHAGRTLGFLLFPLLAAGMLAGTPARALEVGVVTGRIYTSQDSLAPLSERQLRDLKNLGVTSIRMEFEDRDGGVAERVAAYKAVIKTAGQLGIKVIGVLSWSAMADQSLTPGQTTTPADFDSRFVPRFLSTFNWHDATYGNVDGTGFGVEGWELWNEPEGFMFRRGSAYMGEEFALLCVRVYESYRARSGARKIILGGLSRMDDTPILKATFDATPIRNFKSVNGNLLPADIIAIHGYGNTKRPSRTNYSMQGGTFRDQIVALLAMKDAAGRDLIPKTQPLYLTEFGYGTSRGTSTVDYLRQSTQAAELKYVLDTLNTFTQFKRAYWYVYRVDELQTQTDPRGHEWYGLRQVPQASCGNGGITLAYNALANFNGRAGVAQTASGAVVNVGDEASAEGNRSVPACNAFVSTNAIWKAFNRNDTAENQVGAPADNGGGTYVHTWGNGTVQDFAGGALEGGRGSIGLLTGQTEAGYVYGRFLDKWLNTGGAGSLGHPFNNGGGADRHPWASAIASGVVQDFKGGSNGLGQLQMATGTTQVFYLTGAARTEYLRVGDINVLGYATSDLALQGGNTWKQTFQQGYILYDSSTAKASAYRTDGTRL